MGNKNHRKSELFPEHAKHAKNLHLGNGIEGSRWFIGDYERGITGGCLSDQGALPLAPAELVRIRAHDAIRLLRKKLGENFVRPLV